MSISIETKLDCDRTVSTEDRFALRRALDSFVTAVNRAEVDAYQQMLLGGAVIEGFSDIPQLKQEFISTLSRRFTGDNNNLMRFPKLKSSYNRFMFHAEGTYEEYRDGILATEGSIELALVKTNDKFQIAKIVFYPRMLLNEENA